MDSTAVATEVSEEQRLLSRLRRFGITTWAEVLLCMPLDYEDYQAEESLSSGAPRHDIEDSQRTYALTAASAPNVVSGPKTRLKFTASDGTRFVSITIFGGPDQFASWARLEVGDNFATRGKLQNWGGTLQLTNPEWIELRDLGSVRPIYPSRKGVLAKGALFQATRFCLAEHKRSAAALLLSSFSGMAERDVLREADIPVPSIEYILDVVHNPPSLKRGELALMAMRRLAALSVVINARRMKDRTPVKGSSIALSPDQIAAVHGEYKLTPTGDQAAAIRHIIDDLAQPFPMSRLLSGDVGTGKGICIKIAVALVQSSGRRAVVLMPTEILARQFANDLAAEFDPPRAVHLVTAKTKAIPRGNEILVGTTALLGRIADEEPPALLCVDEEQKLSIQQKAQLAAKRTNCLHATATPIPRTTALITHGAMDVSHIKEQPFQKDVQSFLITQGEGARLFEHTRRVIDAGGQVAVIYPRVKGEESDKQSIQGVVAQWERHFPGRVAVIHGQLTNEQKEQAMTPIYSGEAAVTIASTVIEVGVTIPKLRTLVVIDPERYGTSTLHQLRGRAARHGGKGYFFMLTRRQLKPEASERLNLVVEHADGFALSEADAQLRGFGDLFADGERQAGASRSCVVRGLELTPADLSQFFNTNKPETAGHPIQG